MNKKLYRLNELSDLLSIGKSTIWAWVKDNKFPKPVQLSPRMTVWKSQDVEVWLKEQNLDKQDQQDSKE